MYEAHRKGLTKFYPGIPKESRGTYAGIAHPEIIAYLKKLRITALEMIPVRHFVSYRSLKEKASATVLVVDTNPDSRTFDCM
jgi:isoamylase